MALLGGQSLVVAVAHVVGHGFIQLLLRRVPRLPRHRVQAREPGPEQRLAFGIDGGTLFGADHEGLHALAADAAFIWESVPVQQLHQAHELVGLALMRRGREQQQVGRGLRQRRAQLVARYLLGAAAHAVRFVDDDQVPRRRHQILEAFAVVGLDLL